MFLFLREKINDDDDDWWQSSQKYISAPTHQKSFVFQVADPSPV